MPLHHENIKMERALAEEMVRELLVIGENLNRLNDLIEAHIAEEALKKEFKIALGEAMAGGVVLLLPIIQLYPDLDPDK
jgi:hypothetical protein